ncbi:uncharacterized protein LOC143857014 [Tasmannia lanceolata]|uniref:uncharacterized protein LOC143857014 n=1 Tax=Tasmannia lanceolata TaxID=3420 RepID=UPI00406301E2
MEASSLMISKAARLGYINDRKPSRNSISLTHLQFADYTLCFIEDDEKSIANLKRVFRWFKVCSGMKINFAKGSIAGIKIEHSLVEHYARRIGCGVEVLPITYLGLPLGDRIGKIRLRNKALLAKWLWRYGEEKRALWHRVVREKYGKELGEWKAGVPVRGRGSAAWRSIASICGCFDQYIRFCVGKGDEVRFWLDLWIGDTPLCQKFPNLFRLVVKANVMVSEYLIRDGHHGRGVWDIRLRRNLKENEIESHRVVKDVGIPLLSAG